MIPVGLQFKAFSSWGSLLLTLWIGPFLVAQDFYVAPDVPTNLTGTDYHHYDIISSTSGLFALEASLDPGLAIQALSKRTSGWLFVPATPTELDGTTFTPQHIVLWRNGTYSLFFDLSPFLSPEVQIDALCEEPGTNYLVFSITTPAGSFSQNDLIRFNGLYPELAWDAESHGIPPSSNVTAIHMDACGVTFLAFNVPTQIGGSNYLPGEVVSWDGSAFNSYSKSASWPLSSQIFGLTFEKFLQATATVSGDALICQGEPVDIQVDLTGTPPWDLQWSDGVNQTGVTQTPVIRTVNPAVNTRYSLAAFEDSHCEGIRYGMATVIINDTFNIATHPTTQCQGLTIGSFSVLIACDSPPTTVNWSTNPATPFTALGPNMSFNAPPSALRTRVTARVTDSSTRAALTSNAYFLTAQNTHFFDHNGDGCNDLHDLWEFAATSWRKSYPSDPDGNGFINVLDFLFINLDHIGGCP